MRLAVALFCLMVFTGCKKNEPPAPSATGRGAVHPALSAPGAAAVVGGKVERAPGGKTVAEIYAQRAQLKDTQVSVRGRVVKYSSGILGKNWLHLRDGSGQEGKDNDLTVTTTDQASVGQVVVVTGPVHLERDFGAGYSYAVILEDARVSQ